MMSRVRRGAIAKLGVSRSSWWLMWGVFAILWIVYHNKTLKEITYNYCKLKYVEVNMNFILYVTDKFDVDKSCSPGTRSLSKCLPGIININKDIDKVTQFLFPVHSTVVEKYWTITPFLTICPSESSLSPSSWTLVKFRLLLEVVFYFYADVKMVTAATIWTNFPGLNTRHPADFLDFLVLIGADHKTWK